jgi:TolB-like protein/Tfp pilus assembly protein PilF
MTGSPIQNDGAEPNGTAAVATPQPSAEAIRKALEKILTSRAFETASAQRNFLRYVVEQTLQGRRDLKEYSVAIDVFGRDETFDPRRSSIVRTEAQKLRSRLARYYENEGREDPVYIEFVKGGYSPTFHNTAPKATEDTQTAGPPQVAAKRPLISRKAAVPILVLLALVSSATYFFLNSNRRAVTSGPPSVAVLPFVNMSGNAQDEFFSDGLTEDLIDSLVRVPGLHVVARTSVFQFKSKSADVRKIGQELNVQRVLTGSVRKQGNQLRITAQLSDTTNGYQLWAASYDRELKDALAIQEEISHAIVEALGGELAARVASPRSKTDSGKTAARNPEGYENYLKGRYFWNKNTAEDTQTAIRYFEQAIAKDPEYAPAYVGLAHGWIMMPVYTRTPVKAAVAKIRAAALKALELEPTLGEAHVDLGRALVYTFEWGAAEQEFKKALALNPGDSVAHQWYGQFLMRMGRLDQATQEYKTALSLDPVSPFAAQSTARPLYFMRRYDDAIAQYNKALALEPNFGITRQALGLAYLLNGMYADGIRETEIARKLMSGDSVTTGQLGYGYAMSGNIAGARQLLAGLLESREGPGVPALAIAEIYIGLKDKDEAFTWLHHAIEQQDVNMSLKVDPIYDSLRSDSRFQDLLREIHLL